MAVLVNPDYPDAGIQIKEVEEAARTLGLQLHILKARIESDFDTAFATIVQQRAGALPVASDPFLFSRREQLVALAARHAVPAIYQFRQNAAEFVINLKTAKALVIKFSDNLLSLADEVIE
jgi:putative tryptophan/tyrosine transport system substrate-binding protein